FLVASVLAAGAVVLAGPIAFVGLVSPHLTRLLIGPSHRTLLVGSAMLGAILLLLADIAGVGLGRRFDVGVMPLGIFTAMVGGPVFLWMLRPQLGRGE
ncbi:MAG: iron chelate uptake ABC transporter family permease subunit, partial [Phycisphaeraceae bacterium]